MKILVNKEDVFRTRGNNMAIGATTSGYSLEYSVDNEHFTMYGDGPIPANEALLISEAVSGLYVRLKGNTDDGVIVRF